MAAWTLGTALPVWHHVALYGAVAGRPTTNIITDMRAVFDFLPWIDWLYFTLMLAVGAVLVVSGLWDRTQRTPPFRPDRLAVGSPRGFALDADARTAGGVSGGAHATET